MSLIYKVLTSPEILEQPPVLLDIGASGQIHRSWKQIARYSECIAFDADQREMDYVEKQQSGFKKLHIFNCILSDTDKNETDFYLTKSPYCSSILEPDIEALNVWAFSDKFKIEQKVNLKSMNLKQVLKQLKLNRIDWFKTDSQGTDLRLFKSLSEDIQNKILVAEFEPGIIDSYKGEDKFYELLRYMDNKNFWLSNLTIKGSHRISSNELNEISGSGLMQKIIQYSMNKAPGWSETSFINSFEIDLSKREYLLGWVFSTIQHQHGFALTLSKKGAKLFGDKIFPEMTEHSIKNIKKGIYKLKFMPAVLEKIFKSLKLK